MNRKILLGAVAASLVTVLAACGDSGSSGPTFSDSVSTADAQDFAGDAVSGVADAIDQLNFGTGVIGLAAPAFVTRMQAEHPFLGARLGSSRLQGAPSLPDWRTVAANPAGFHASAAEGCTITESGFQYGGGVVDVDQNGIPDDLFIKEECFQTDSTSNPDTTITTYVLLQEHLKQNFASLYGFDISFDAQQKLSDQFGNFGMEKTHATESLDIRSGSATHGFNYVTGESGKFDTASSAIEFGTGFNVAFTPTGTITLGDPLPNGSVVLSGREYLTNTEDQNLSFTLSTTTPLAYDASCYAGASNPPFTAGVLRGLLNNNASSASFTATFTACGVAPTIGTSGTFASATP